MLWPFVTREANGHIERKLIWTNDPHFLAIDPIFCVNLGQETNAISAEYEMCKPFHLVRNGQCWPVEERRIRCQD